jgi:hypothetical protein
MGSRCRVLLTIENAPSHAAVRAFEACAKANIIVLTFPPHMTHLLQPIEVFRARSFKSLFSELFRDWSEERLRLASGVAELVFERASAAQRLRVKVVTSMVDAARSATEILTCNVAFEECGLLPFDASWRRSWRSGVYGTSTRIRN